MRNAWKIVFCLAALCLLTVAMSLGQSLGDVAREQQQKKKDQAKNTSSPHKVVTNEDIPESPDADNLVSDDGKHDQTSAPASSSGKTAEQWKAEIQGQKGQVASLQAQLDKLNSSIHYVEANRYTNGVQYNQYQAQKQQEAQRMQKQLDDQKKKLEDMQEAARKAGMGNAVYDPEP